MNIYLHIELAVRELDSKLLLATLAASRGHQVIISDLESIIKGMNMGILSPGIFHTKSLTPAKHKIATPADWKPGDDVIIVPKVTNEEAKKIYPDGWETIKPYLRKVPDPQK